MMKYIPYIGILSLFLYPSICAKSHTDFLYIGIENGLSNNSVTGIVQDSIGFIWIGTKHGLNRYDATNFKVYSPEQHYLLSNDISVLKIDSRNRLWVGTSDNGLFLYNPFIDKFQQITFDESPRNENRSVEVHALHEDKNGSIWIATEQGLFSYDISGKSKHYMLEKRKSDVYGKNDIRAIIDAPDNKLWIGTFGSGLYLFDKDTGQFTEFDAFSFSGLKINTDYINTLFIDNNGNLLIGTNGSGLKVIDFIQNKITNYFAGTAYKELAIVRCIQQDKNNNLWIGTDGDGILFINRWINGDVEIENYRNKQNIPNSLSNNTINTFFEDRQSNLWIGTAKRGINLLKKEPAEIEFYYSDGKGMYKVPILSIFSDKNGLWMGTDGEGLALLDVNKTDDYFFNNTTTNGNVGDFIQCIKPANDGSLWIGTFTQGLYHFNPNTQDISNYVRDPIAKNSISHNNVRNIIVMPSGNLWIATWGGGLVYFDIEADTTIIYKHEPRDPESLGNNNVLDFCFDNSGQLWLATYGGGLSMFNPTTKKFKNYKAETSSGLSSNYIFTLLLGEKNGLWLGTKEGLVFFNIQTLEFTPINMENADSQRKTVVSLLDDMNGNIWGGTHKGIMHVKKENHNINFIPNLYDNFQMNAVFIDNDGKLYFGGNERIVAFHPSQIQFETFSPSICFVDLKISNKSIPIDNKGILKRQICFEKKVTLKYNQSVITIEYAALDYPFSKHVTYEVKLEGNENEWHNVGNQNSITFTNLSPGKYVFLVRPTGTPLYSHTEPSFLEIHILPPFWLTWWAYYIYFAIILGIFYLYRKYILRWTGIKNELKLEKLKREQKESIYELKQVFFTNLSHDIRTPLTLIAGSINKLFNKESVDITDQKYLKIIRTNTNRLLNLTGELLNFRKLETGNVTLQVSHENLVEFAKEIFVSYTQLAISKNINYKFESSHLEILVWIDRIQFERAVCNLISNAFKYTPEGGEIIIKVSLKSDKAFISVIDTGQGIEEGKINYIFNQFFQVDKQSEGNGFGVGLSITKEVILLHNGEISVSSVPGKGSEFCISLLLGYEHLKNVEFIKPPLRTDILSENFVVNSTDVLYGNLPEQNGMEYSVLIVEDNPDIRAFLNELLSSKYSIYEASNGNEGFERAIELVPDIIISDIMMPVMDGITFCSKIKSDMRTSHIPVILLTARTLENSIIEGFENGADEYLIKPFNVQLLLTRINNLLLNRRKIREKISKDLIINPHEVALNSQDAIFLTKLVNYIEEHIEESELNIAQLASMMAMSHSNLYKKVKALTSMTVIGFIKDFRLKRAAQLLIQNQYPVSEIAYMVGYSERRHFSNDFKRKFNLSPKVYMEINKKK